MGEDNKVFSPLNLLKIFKDQDNELLNMDQNGLNLDLSIGSSHTTQPSMMQEFPLNDNNYDNIYREAINNYNFGQNFGQQVLARSVYVPSEVEAQMKKMEPSKQNVAKKRPSSFPENVNEGGLVNGAVESVRKNPAFCRAMEKLKSARGKFSPMYSGYISVPEDSDSARIASPYHPKANSVVSKNPAFCRAMGKLKTAHAPENTSSAMTASPYHPKANSGVSKNPAFCWAMGKLKTAHDPESSSSARTASPYHPKANSEANEAGKSAENMYGNDGNKLPAKKEKVSMPDTPVSTQELMENMPRVMVEGPNGINTEGILFKYNKKETVIVCLCHMCFCTPAEFAVHAGLGHVANPLKHIKVFQTDN